MISKERFGQIEPGDYILFGRAWRKVLKTYPYGKTSFCLEFRKINNYQRAGTTTYLYADMYKKIRAICKVKSWK